MRGHHRSRGCLRPRPCQADGEIDGCEGRQRRPDRLFVCAEPACRVQVVICSDCDRGHIYCADCAPHVRLRRLGRSRRAGPLGQPTLATTKRSQGYRDELADDSIADVKVTDAVAQARQRKDTPGGSHWA